MNDRVEKAYRGYVAKEAAMQLGASLLRGAGGTLASYGRRILPTLKTFYGTFVPGRGVYEDAARQLGNLHGAGGGIFGPGIGGVGGKSMMGGMRHVSDIFHGATRGGLGQIDDVMRSKSLRLGGGVSDFMADPNALRLGTTANWSSRSGRLMQAGKNVWNTVRAPFTASGRAGMREGFQRRMATTPGLSKNWANNRTMDFMSKLRPEEQQLMSKLYQRVQSGQLTPEDAMRIFSKESWGKNMAMGEFMPHFQNAQLPASGGAYLAREIGRRGAMPLGAAALTSAPFWPEMLSSTAGSASTGIGAEGRMRDAGMRGAASMYDAYSNAPLMQRLQMAWNPQNMVNNVYGSAPAVGSMHYYLYGQGKNTPIHARSASLGGVLNNILMPGQQGDLIAPFMQQHMWEQMRKAGGMRKQAEMLLPAAGRLGAKMLPALRAGFNLGPRIPQYGTMINRVGGKVPHGVGKYFSDVLAKAKAHPWYTAGALATIGGAGYALPAARRNMMEQQEQMGYGAGAAKVMEEFANAPMWQRLAGAVMPGLAERHVAQQYPQFRQALEQQRAARMANMYYRPGQGYR